GPSPCLALICREISVRICPCGFAASRRRRHLAACVVEAAVELRTHEDHCGHDGHRDQGDEEEVLDEVRSPLVLREPGLEPGLEHEEIHGCCPLLRGGRRTGRIRRKTRSGRSVVVDRAPAPRYCCRKPKPPDVVASAQPALSLLPVVSNLLLTWPRRKT